MTVEGEGWRRLSDEEAAALRPLVPDNTVHSAADVATWVALSTRIDALRSESDALEANIAAARNAAIEAGYRAGHQRAEAEVARVVAELRDGVAALHGRAALVALAAAEAVLHAEVSTTPALMQARIEALLAESPQRPTRIRLSPQLHAALAPELAQLPLVLVPDPSLAPADAILELATGQLDARVQLALQRIGAHVDAELGAGSQNEQSDG